MPQTLTEKACSVKRLFDAVRSLWQFETPYNPTGDGFQTDKPHVIFATKPQYCWTTVFPVLAIIFTTVFLSLFEIDFCGL
jgi:hypothetical protein